MTDAKEHDPIPEAEALFVVTVNGPAACSVIASGLEGVREAILQAVWRGPRDFVPDDVAAAMEELEDPSAWATHGHGDGRPYWHWWKGLVDGSVSVQRITDQAKQAEASPQGTPLSAELRAALAVLVACSEQLRQFMQR